MAHHIVFKIMIWVMVISFIITGFSNSILLLIGGSNRDYAAKVNGQEQEDIGQQLTEAYRRKQVLFQLIDEMLLEQYAKSIGLVISQDKIKNTILAIPAFHTDNKFDNVKYR